MSVEGLSENLNIIQDLVIPGLDTDLDVIQSLDDEPNDVGGLTAAELKGKFDQSGNAIKNYINNTLLPAISDTVAEEAVRAEAETTRQTQETARQTAESGRASAEQSRVSAEGVRQAQESARGTAEQARASAETAREQTEVARVSAEQARVSAESARVLAETARESSMQQVESALESAEQGRVTAEQGRVSAEAARNVWENYSNSKRYVPGNKVAYGGSSYVCTAPTAGNAPADTAYWTLIAAKGQDGQGVGDMLSATYDPSGKAQDVFAYADAAEAAAKAASRPSTWMPSASEVGAAPSSHTHPASDLTTAVPVAKGGTGASTAEGARKNLGACANALESATAAALGLTGDATVNDGLAKLALGPFEIGDTLSTLRTDLGDKWLLCNGEDLDTNTYPELAKKITELNFSDFITEGYATGEIYSEAEYGGVYVQAGQITSTYGGAYKALLWYSTNPRGSTNDWNKCTLSEFFDGILTKVRVHNGTWVAVGYQRDNLYPYILTTTNPKGTWTVKQLLKTPCMLSGLVYAFNKWVAVGSVGSGQPKVFTATDPSGSWSDGVLSTTTNLNITNIAFNGTFLCAVGYDNSDVPYLVKNTSLSGTWETTRMTISNQPTSHPKIHPNSIAFSNGNWVVGCAVDEVNDYTWLARILVSSDLVTWTYKKIKSSDLTYVHAKYGAFVNFYNNKWYVTSSMERDQSYLCWTDNLGDSWSVKKLSSSGCCVKGADVANGYLFILGREYRSEKVGYYVVNKILPRISLNGVYTYIKAKE